MTTAPSLTELLTARFATLSAKQRSVAELLDRDPAFVAFASASEVADRAGVDTATVVRTCQRLGYSGWRELHQEVKRSTHARRTFADRVAALETPAGELTERVFQLSRDNVTETLHGLDHAALDASAEAISRASMVVVAAGGVATGMGQFLSSSLQIIGQRAVLTTGAGDAPPALAPLGADDVVVGISMWRYLTATVQALEHAANTVGATTVAITDSSVSPAALLADHTLVARTDTAGPRLGLTGVQTLLESLVAQVAVLQPEQSRRASEVASRFYYTDNVLGSTDAEAADRP